MQWNSRSRKYEGSKDGDDSWKLMKSVFSSTIFCVLSNYCWSLLLVSEQTWLTLRTLAHQIYTVQIVLSMHISTTTETILATRRDPALWGRVFDASLPMPTYHTQVYLWESVVSSEVNTWKKFPKHSVWNLWDNSKN